MGTYDIPRLNALCARVRSDIIDMLAAAGSGHPGGSLSVVEILVSLYAGVMKHDPRNPRWPERDIFLLSKGHGCPALYAVLAELGYFDRAELASLRKLGSRLQGHPAGPAVLPGLEIASGSLGQGLSVAVGAALGVRLQQPARRVYCVMSDGEQQEGSTWEAAMAAGHFKLNNLCAVVDHNTLQIDGPVEQVMGIAPIEDKYRAFRWEVLTVDGHDCEALLDAFTHAAGVRGAPVLIVARTVKGKGISFMENVVDWHGKAPSPELARKALDELGS